VAFNVPTGDFQATVSWYSLLIYAFILVLLIVPVAFWRRRLAYAATFCVVAMCLFAVLWGVDWAGSNSAALMFSNDTATSREYTNLVLTSQRGAIAVAVTTGVTHDPIELRFKHGSPEFRWYRTVFDAGYVSYLQFPLPEGDRATVSVKRWGFQLLAFGEPDLYGTPIKPNEPRSVRILRTRARLHSWALVLPNWFLILILSLIPARFVYYRRWGLRRSRKRNNLCEKCGYSLQGLPLRRSCPECGTKNEGTASPPSIPTAECSKN
jgi:hypothetical protein